MEDKMKYLQLIVLECVYICGFLCVGVCEWVCVYVCNCVCVLFLCPSFALSIFLFLFDYLTFFVYLHERELQRPLESRSTAQISDFMNITRCISNYSS